MKTHRAASKIEEQYRKPGLAIHKIVNTAIELGCTDTVAVEREKLLSRLTKLHGEDEIAWTKRLAQAFSDKGNAYGQYFVRKGAGVCFYPLVWQAIKQVGWGAESGCITESTPEATAADGSPQTSRTESECTMPKKKNALQIGAWGTFSLELIGSSTPYKVPDYFRADVSVERLKSAVLAGATFLFVYVNKGTRAFAIPAHSLQEACKLHKVSVNTNGTPRYELYINHVKGEICRNAGPNGRIAVFPYIS